MRFTTLTQQRGKMTIRTGISVQIDNMSYQTATELGGQSPYDSYWIYTTGGELRDIRRGDLLIDEQGCEDDPLTGAPERFRVFGNPEPFTASHTEIPVEKIIGT